MTEHKKFSSRQLRSIVSKVRKAVSEPFESIVEHIRMQNDKIRTLKYALDRAKTYIPLEVAAIRKLDVVAGLFNYGCWTLEKKGKLYTATFATKTKIKATASDREIFAAVCMACDNLRAYKEDKAEAIIEIKAHGRDADDIRRNGL